MSRFYKPELGMWNLWQPVRGILEKFAQQRQAAPVITRAGPVTGGLKKEIKSIPIQIKTLDRTAQTCQDAAFLPCL